MKTISYDEIKKKLIYHNNPHDPAVDADIPMSVSRHRHPDIDDSDTMFFLVYGSPPRGYGIFIKARKLLILYTARGGPFVKIDVDEVVPSVVAT